MKSRNLFRLLFASGAAASAIGYSADSESQRCSRLRNLKIALAGSTITTTEYLPSNHTFIIPGAHPTCTQNATTTAAICRVQITTKTSSTSSVKAEVWLPDPHHDTHRVAATGNGGLNGCISYDSLVYLSSLGFAVAGSDGGHTGMTGEPFLNHPEVITDFSYRSIHVQSVLVKEISAAYYGQKHKKSYYVGCSTGGRQGFKALEMHPKDFDGVIAGAPALDVNRLTAIFSILDHAQGLPGNSSYITPALFQIIQKDVLAQCDGLDGVVNGVIDNPDSCKYTPSPSIVCSSNSSSSPDACLTPPQIKTLSTMFTQQIGPFGEPVGARYDPGSDFQWILRRFLLIYPDWYKYAIYNSPTLDPTAPSFNTTQAIIDSSKLDPAGVSTWPPTKAGLEPFVKHGGKLLHYHGRADGMIFSGTSIRWLKEAQKVLGEKRLREFYRFFPIPGMDHCSGGAGTGGLGQIGSQGSDALKNDEKHNLVLALVKWVEEGRTPEEIIGWNKRRGQTRTLCAYPKKSVPKKGGNVNEASGWKCVD